MKLPNKKLNRSYDSYWTNDRSEPSKYHKVKFKRMHNNAEQRGLTIRDYTF